METIAANPVFLVEYIGDTINVGMRRHFLMESCVVHPHLRNIGQYLLTGINTADIVRVMQGSKFNQITQGTHQLGGDKDRSLKFFTTMDDPMPDTTCVFCGQCVEVCPTHAIRFVDKENILYPEIDKQYCIGCGACAVTAPDFWEMNDDGKSSIIGGKEKENGWQELEIDEKDFDVNKEAAESCPVEVIHLVDAETNEKII